VSYFNGIENQIYRSYSHMKTMRELGIVSPHNDITLLELDAYSIIEEELAKYKNQTIEKHTKEIEKHGRNSRN